MSGRKKQPVVFTGNENMRRMLVCNLGVSRSRLESEARKDKRRKSIGDEEATNEGRQL
jgi:hypothetical protein